MAKSSLDRDYYFDDRDAPDGWQTYRLRRSGEDRALYRVERGSGKEVVVKKPGSEKPVPQGELKALECFLQNPERAFLKTEISPSVLLAEQYLSKLRKLFNDSPPFRLFQTAGVGLLLFAQEVRDTPSRFLSVYRRQLKQHWKPRAMGAGAGGAGARGPGPLYLGGNWYFSGRTSVLRQIIQWLDQRTSEGIACIVTGDPGSGKSAVLGYLVTASDLAEIQVPQLKEFLGWMPEWTRPKPGGIDFAIDLWGRTVDQTLDALADCFQSTPDEVIATLAKRAKRAVLVFDGLDEAADPVDIVEQVLRPLTGHNYIWLLIGCRRPELRGLGGSVSVLDLDKPEFRDNAGLAKYVENLLLGASETKESLYRDDISAARKAAELVAKSACGNFLVAFLIARWVVEGRTKLDLDSNTLPRTPDDAFNSYLRRLGERSEWGHARFREALIPLAYSRGAGLPIHVWALLIDEKVHDILELAAAFITEYEEDGHTVYRLYHASLSEVLRQTKRGAEMHRTIADKLIAAVPEQDWFQAVWYTRKYLAQHAVAGGVLDKLVLDTKFLAAADPPELLRVVDGVSSDEARRRVSWYRLTADRLARTQDFGERLSYLELTARQHAAVDLADSTKDRLTRRWTVSWAIWNSETPHSVLRGHTGHVYDVAIRGEVVISGGEDGTLRLWDIRTGKQLISALWGHDGGIRAVAFAAGKLLSGGIDMTVRVWDPTTGEQLAQLGTHPFMVTAIVVSGDEAVSASADGTLIHWNLVSGQEINRISIGDYITSFSSYGLWCAVGTSDGKVFLFNGAFAEVRRFHFPGLLWLEIREDLLILGTTHKVQIYNWRLEKQIESKSFDDSVLARAIDGDLIASSGFDGAIRCWNWRTGIPITSHLRGHDDRITALAASGGFVASGSFDGTVRLWNLNNIARVGNIEYSEGSLRALTAFENVVVGATTDHSIRLWDLEAPGLGSTVISKHSPCYVVALAIDSEAIMAISRDYVASSAGHYTFFRWDRNGGSVIIQDLLLDTSGSALAMTRDMVAIGCGHGDVHIFPIVNGRVAGAACASMKMHTMSVKALAIAGRMVVSAGLNGMVQMWDTETAFLGPSLQLESKYSPSALGLGNRVIAAITWQGDLQIFDRRSGLKIGTINLGSKVSNIAVEGDCIYASCPKGIVRVDWHGFS